MRSTTANYDNENIGDKKPVGIVELNDKSGLVTGAEYSSQTFNNIVTTGHKKYVRNMRLQTDVVDIVSNALPQQTSLVMEVRDGEGDIRGKLSNNSVIEVVAKVGMQELDDTDFVSLPTQRITKTQLVNDVGWRFITQDARRLFTGNIFRGFPQGTLNGAETAATTAITLNDVSKFVDPANFANLNGNIDDWLFSGIQIGNEKCSVSSITGNDLNVTRGIQGTTAQAYDDGTLVDQFYYTSVDQLDPFTWAEILLYILLTTDDASGHNYYDLSRADGNFAGFGLGLSADDVDIEGIERLGYKISPWTQLLQDLYFVFKGEQNAAKWINDNILVPNGIIAFINSSGKLTCESIDFVHLNETFSAATTLDTTNVTAALLNIEDNKLYNSIEVRAIDPYLANKKSLRAELDSSVTAYGKNKTPLEIRVPYPGMEATSPATPSEEWIVSRWLYLFGNVSGIVSLSVKFEDWLLEPGDFVNITWPRFPELTDGTLGWTNKKALILSQNASFDFVSQQYSFNYDCFVWELYDKVSSFYTVVATIAQGSITDTVVTYDAAATALNDPPDAADGHHDFGATVSPDLWMATLTITPPNSGSTEHSVQIRIELAENVASVYTSRWNREVNIRYNSGDSEAFTVDCMFPSGTDQDVDRVYVHWIDTSAGVSERPTVAFTGLEYYTLDQAMTIS